MMKLTFDRETVTRAIQLVASVVPTRTTKDILKNIKLVVSKDLVLLQGTDGEIGMVYSVPVAERSGSEEALLPTARLLSILRELSADTVRMEFGSGKFRLISGTSEFQLSTEDAGDFPPVDEVSGSQFTVAAPVLKQLIQRTIYAADTQSTRYALGAIQMTFAAGKLTCVATDSRRLAVANGACSGGGDGVVQALPPQKAMSVLERILVNEKGDVVVTIGPNCIGFTCGGVTLRSQLVQGRFPAWDKVVPAKFSAMVDVVAAPFASAIRQAMIVTSEESRGVRFKFGAGSLLLSSETADVGMSRIELPIAYEQPEMLLAFDPRYFQDFLRSIDGGEAVKIGLISSDDPAVLRCGDDYLCVVMPLSQDR